jgi:hypothetical protein
MDGNKKGRYPRAKHTGVSCYHYGWVRSEEQMNLKSQKVQRYWGKRHTNIDYSQIDPMILKEFKGSHPKIIREWLPKDKGVFKPDPSHKTTLKQKRHRIMIKIEKIFATDLSNKHYKLV